eukprot:2869537-Alexandrium_andersonii.AAC.1
MLIPPVPRAREVEERQVLPEVTDIRREEILEDDLAPAVLPQEPLGQVEAHLGGYSDAAEVGDFDGQTKLTVKRPEVARRAPHTRAREDVLHGLGLSLQRL